MEPKAGRASPKPTARSKGRRPSVNTGGLGASPMLTTLEEAPREDEFGSGDEIPVEPEVSVLTPETRAEEDSDVDEPDALSASRGSGTSLTAPHERAPALPTTILADKLEWLAAAEAAAPEIRELRSRVRPLSRALDLARSYPIQPNYPEAFSHSAKSQHRQLSTLRAESLRKLLGLDLEEEEDAIQQQAAKAAASSASSRKKQEDDAAESAIVMTLILQHLNAVRLSGTYAVLRQELAERGVLFEPDQTDAYESRRHESRLLTVLRNAVKRSDKLWSLSSNARTSRAQTDKLEELLFSMGLMNQNALDEDIDVDIWSEPENGTIVFDDFVQVDAGEAQPVRAASLNKLVEQLTSETMVELNLIPTFLLTYRSFTTPDILLEKLKQRFNVPNHIAARRRMDDETFRQRVVRPIQLRVISVIKKWCEEYSYDIDNRLEVEIKDFLKEASKTNTALARLCTGVLAGLERRRGRSPTITQALPPPAKVPRNIFASNLSLYQIDPEEIARQLTLMAWDCFVSIRPPELLNQSWNKPTLRHRAPNVLKMVASFNHLSQSVSTLIVMPKRVKQRTKAMEYWIKVADHCRALNNFHSMTSVVAGINSGSCFRLRHTKHDIAKPLADLLQNCSSILDTDGSWAGYRKRLALATPPLIPHLGIYLTDLVFIEEGNKDLDNGLINFAKRRLLHGTISQIQQFQQTCYSLQPVHQIQELLQRIRPEDSRALMKLSLEREPRGAARESII